MPGDTIQLKCGSCGHENEPERVYCHSCGEKLDRSILPKPEAKKDHEDDATRRKRVQKMMSAGRGWLTRDIRTGVTVLALAAAVAAVFLFWQKPEGTPSEKAELLPERDAGELWEQLMTAPGAFSVTFSEVELNSYLSRAIKGAGGAIPGVDFKRAFVKLEPDVITFTVQRDAWGMAMYSSVSYSTSADGKFAPEVVGVRFGRLSVHPIAAMLGEFAIGGVMNAFEKEKANAARIDKVQVIYGAITVVTKALQ